MLNLQALKFKNKPRAKAPESAFIPGKPDYWMLAILAMLLVFGTVMIYSASFVTASLGDDGNPASILYRHLLWLGVGLVALFVMMQIDYHRWRTVSIAAMLGVIVLLLLVIVLPESFAPNRYGAKRWLTLGAESSWQFQPSEFAKIALVIYSAHWLGSKGDKVRRFMVGVVPFAMTIGFVVALVMAEPDLGTSLVIGAIGLAMFFVAGANIFHLIGGFAMAAGAFGLLAVSAAYRFDRIQAYLNPFADPTGVSYHTVQALVGLGSGGVFGLGLGASRGKFFWLPTVYTDSIFAVIGEELGLMGTCLVVLLFLALAWRGFAIALHAPDGYGRLIATGVTVYIVFQAFLNMAVVSNLVPFTGIPLPFISYGGSSLAVSLAAVGLLLNVSRQQVANPRQLEFERQRQAELRQREFLRSQRSAERERRQALTKLRQLEREEEHSQELGEAQKRWETRNAQERAETVWRENLEREVRQQAEADRAHREAEKARQAEQAAQQEADLPRPASQSFLHFNNKTGQVTKVTDKPNLRKPRRDWAKAYEKAHRRDRDN